MINVAGLTIGFFSVIIISAWIKNELSYDTYLSNYKNIYRLTVEINALDGYHTHFARCSQAWTRQLPDYFSDIEKMALFAPLRRTAIKMNEVKFNSNQVYQCNPEALDVFDISTISGNAQLTLKQPGMVLISENLFNTYFQNIPLMDTVIEMSGAFDTEFSDFKIAGVFKNFPHNAHFHPDILVSFDNLEDFEGWAYTYFMFKKGTDPVQMLDQFPEFADTHFSEDVKNTTAIHLQPISDIHLHSRKDREIEKNGDIKVVYLFFAIGVVVLIITLINFINLNLVVQIKRKHTFILKKILGSEFRDIARQIFFENVILFILAALTSVVFIFLMGPFLESLIRLEIIFEDPWFILFVTLLLITISLVISIIPQLTLIVKHWFKEIRIMGAEKDQSILLKKSNLGIRKMFVIIQFIASIILISSAYYIDQQEKFLWKNRMGFEKESVVVLKELNWSIRDRYTEFTNRLLDYHLIKDITASMEPPSGYVMDAMDVEMEGLPSEEDISIYVFPVDENYTNFYNIPVISGETFSHQPPGTGKEEYILNESALVHLGFKYPEEAVGRQFKLNFSIDSLFKGGTIKGVVKNFNLSPLFEKVKPLVLFPKPIWYSTILIKIDTVNKMESIHLIKEVWDELFPEYLFDYSFDDDLYKAAYHNEILQSRLSKYLTFLALVIACLGLFGLSTIIIKLRMKEICIRKINGASIIDILILLSKEFVQLIIISLIIATPVSWYLLKKWAENYPYKVQLYWWIFPITGVIALLFAWLSISYYSIKAARRNPVEVLRYE